MESYSSKIEKEGMEMMEMQRLYSNLELDYKQSYKEFEMQMKQRDDKIERMQTDYES